MYNFYNMIDDIMDILLFLLNLFLIDSKFSQLYNIVRIATEYKCSIYIFILSNESICFEKNVAFFKCKIRPVLHFVFFSDVKRQLTKLNRQSSWKNKLGTHRIKRKKATRKNIISAKLRYVTTERCSFV